LAFAFQKSRLPFFRRFSQWSLGVGFVIWGFLGSLLSVVMIFLWTMTIHKYTHHNANLLLVWPTDLFLIYVGYKIIRKGVLNLSFKMKKNLKRYLILHGILAFGLGMFYLLGFVVQDIRVGFYYFIPPLLWLSGLFFMRA
jgi:hypothetical protein